MLFMRAYKFVFLFQVISDFCKRQQQNRPFSHIVMDLHQEALAELETTLLDNPWGLPVMPELKTRTINRYFVALLRYVLTTNSPSISLLNYLHWMGMCHSME